MPHRGSTRSSRSTSAHTGESKARPSNYRYNKQSKFSKSHNRRNTEPIPDAKVHAHVPFSLSSKSWGSIVDFTSLFFPNSKKGSKSINAQPNGHGSPNEKKCTTSMEDTSPTPISPSGTSYTTLDVDEEYDSSNSGDSYGRLHKNCTQSRLEYLDMQNVTTPINQYNTQSNYYPDSFDAIQRDCSSSASSAPSLMDTTNTIAAQWISMAAISVETGQNNAIPSDQQQRICYPYFSEGGIEVTGGTWFSSSSGSSDDDYSELYGLMADETFDGDGGQVYGDWSAKDKSTPRDSIGPNFPDGTQIGRSRAQYAPRIFYSEQQQLQVQHRNSDSLTSTTNHHQQQQKSTTSTNFDHHQAKWATVESYHGYEHQLLAHQSSNTNTSSQQASSTNPSSESHSQSLGSEQETSLTNTSMNRNMDENDCTSSDDGSNNNHDDDESDSDIENKEEEEKLRNEAALWKTAVDPKSGRTYYYNTQTLETQWRKPLCCATPSERRAAIKKEKQTLAFFASMEQNILRSMQQGQQQQKQQQNQFRHSMFEKALSKRDGKSLQQLQEQEQMDGIQKEEHVSQHRRESEPPSSLHNPFKLIRTISTMEDSVLAALVQRVPSFRHSMSTNNTVRFGTGNSFTTFVRRHNGSDDDLDEIEDSIIHHDNDNADEGADGSFTRQVPLREDSLSFGAVMGSTQSQRGFNASNNNDNNSNNSFTMSSMLRTNSLYQSKFNNFDYIPEGENEDNSESCSNHVESSNGELSPARSLVRQSGFINLNKPELVSLLEETNGSKQNNESSNDTKSHFSFRDSLRRMTGSLALKVQETDEATLRKEPITREDSLNLLEATGGTKHQLMNRDPSSMAFKETEHPWGSFLSESAMRGLSIDESEAMLELASITDRMGDIHSDTSASSDNSDADDLKNLTENVEPRVNGNDSADNMFDSNQFNSSDSVGWGSIPELFADKSHHKQGNADSFRPSMIRPTSLRNPVSRAVLENVSSKISKKEKPTMTRRNTCGTLYVGSTLSAPDKDATIKCVCAVYRAHIVQATLDRDENEGDKYRVFNDRFKNVAATNDDDNSVAASSSLPSLEDVTVFYRDVFTRAQMESDCIIITLIYVERLIKVTEGMLRPSIFNWRSVLFSCMVMASKVWDDLSMWNADFSHTCPAGVQFSLSRINELEIAVLSALQYKVKVPASEYAKYYFLLRSMLIKSGLGSDDLKSMNPLDVEGAKNLQHISSQYQSSVALMSDRQKVAMGRSKTTGGRHIGPVVGTNQHHVVMDLSTHSSSSDSISPRTSPVVSDTQQHLQQQRSKVGLEHLVQL